MATIATWLAMDNHNLSSNWYLQNDLDRVSVAIFSRIANVDCSSRTVRSRNMLCECDIALEWYYMKIFMCEMFM